jgi:hypothetical protein
MFPYSPFILLYVCNLSSKSLLYYDIQYPKYLNSFTCSMILSSITIFTLCMLFPRIVIDFVFVLDIVILNFLAIRFNWYAIFCNSSSDVSNIKLQNYKKCTCIAFHCICTATRLLAANNYNLGE